MKPDNYFRTEGVSNTNSTASANCHDCYRDVTFYELPLLFIQFNEFASAPLVRFFANVLLRMAANLVIVGSSKRLLDQMKSAGVVR